MKKIALAIVCLCGISFANDYDPVKGEMLAFSCAGCHGTDGKSNGIMPTIAGMGKTSMQKTLLDYKYGRKTGTMMTKHVKGFSDDELEQVAYYFSKVKR
ncbi:c-type cytochrome [Arcobacteraceae bacterium]|nr:c-type cytochrome [Arcobacteraceae bacterium]